MLEMLNYEELENIFSDDEVICDEVATQYTGYICDAIMEGADNAVPIYDKELCEACWELNDWVAEASAQGLLGGRNVDLFDMLRMGAYEYYNQLLYNNLETIVYNHAIEYISNEYSEWLEKMEEDDLRDKLDSIDNNNTFEDIESIIDDYIEELKEEEEEEE